MTRIARNLDGGRLSPSKENEDCYEAHAKISSAAAFLRYPARPLPVRAIQSLAAAIVRLPQANHPCGCHLSREPYARQSFSFFGSALHHSRRSKRRNRVQS